MKRKTLVATGIATAVVVALGAGYAYSASNNRPVVGTARATVAPLSVTVSASGSLVAARTAGVYPPTAGTLATVRVHDGDPVKAGATLATLTTGPLKLAVAQAKAAHTAARAQVEAINNGLPSAIERSAANAALSAARSQVSTAAKNYAAYLADYRDANADEKDQMRPTLRTLSSAKASANAALKAAQAQLGRLSASGRVALARTAANQSVTATGKALDQAEANLSKTTLKAPFAGTVTLHGTVEKGSGVTPGVPVFTVADPKRMEFEAQVNESDIAGVATKQPVDVTLDAFPDAFTGKVTRVQTTAQTNATGNITFAVRVAFDAGEARLFAGMSGSADITVQSIPDALTVPVESVITTGATRAVFLVGADGVAHRREVTVGATTDIAVQILSGLSAGDVVATTGASALTDGQQVRTS